MSRPSITTPPPAPRSRCWPTSTSRTCGSRATDAAALSISGVRIARVTSWPSMVMRAVDLLGTRAPRQRRRPRIVVERHAVLRRLPRDRAIHRAGIDVPVAKPLGDRARQRALARAGRSINRNHEFLHVSRRTVVNTCEPSSNDACHLTRASQRKASDSSRSRSSFVVGFLALPYLDALGFIIRAADLPGTRRRSRRGAPPPFTRDPDITRADARRRYPGAAIIRPGRQTRRTHAADAGRASRRHQRIAPGRPRRRSRRDRIRRADRRRARSAAIQDHAAGHRRDRGRGEVDQRAAAVPHRRQDRHRRHQLFRRAVDRRRRPRVDPRSRRVRDVVRRARRSGARDALPHDRRSARRSRSRPSAVRPCSAPITSACIRRTTTASRSRC